MYKIIGTDAKEYGPASVEQIRQWLSEGCVNAQSKGQAEGSVEWRPLAEFPEFADWLKGGVIGPPSRPPGASRTSGMAIASLVLGLLGLLTFLGFLSSLVGGRVFPDAREGSGLESLARTIMGAVLCVPGLVGLLLGIGSLAKIRGSNGALRGWGLALAGSITCGMLLVLVLLWANFVLGAVKGEALPAG